MKALVTSKISAITDRVVGTVNDAREKATKIWKHVRDIPYDVFGITTQDVDALTNGDALTCYGKSLLHASMLESAGVPWRFELSSCPSTNVKETIQGIGNPVVMKLYEKFPGLFKGNELMHSTVQVNVDGNWKRMDATIPASVCDKIKDPGKRQTCHTLDNVTAMHGCRVLNHAKELPANVVTSWNLVSKAGKWVSKQFLGGRAGQG